MVIRYLVLDVDGTLTDGKIYMSENGEAFKAFSVKDGYGIHDIIIPSGIRPIIITGRKSTILERRCEELGIKSLYQGIRDKEGLLMDIVGLEGLKTVAYMGDDLNDMKIIQMVRKAGGVTACPKDAVREIIDSVDFVSIKNGGEGAVRDFIDWMKKKNFLDEKRIDDGKY